MRQIAYDQLRHTIRFAFGQLPRSVTRALCRGNGEARYRAAGQAARSVAERTKAWEVFADEPAATLADRARVFETVILALTPATVRGLYEGAARGQSINEATQAVIDRMATWEIMVPEPSGAHGDGCRPARYY